ncbi:MAG: hypothetical protein ACRECX_13385 [Methyloceanibacter sp.]|uniref:hypothetical protein n=1 Tax=Methyloceanibacter sp. TaxID=1965321 RepID=UPI003D6D0000
MSAPSLCRWAIFGLCLAGLAAAPAAARDADLCLIAAERASAGETLSEEEKKTAHEACLRALSDTASITQKYQFQEADFEIMGTRPKN